MKGADAPAAGESHLCQSGSAARYRCLVAVGSGVAPQQAAEVKRGVVVCAGGLVAVRATVHLLAAAACREVGMWQECQCKP